MKRELIRKLVLELVFFGAVVGTGLLIMWLTDWQPFWVILTVAVVAFGSRSWFDSRRNRTTQRGVEAPPDAEQTTSPHA